MAPNDLVRRLIEAGTHFSEMSQKSAEKLVKDLVSQGTVRRREAEALVETLASRGRDTTEQLLALAERLFDEQAAQFTARFEALEHRLDEVLRRVTGRTSSPSAASEAPTGAQQAAAEKKPAAKKPAAKKAAAKKKPAKKKPAKKAAAKKKAPKKKAATTSVDGDAATSVAGASGVRPIATRRAPS